MATPVHAGAGAAPVAATALLGKKTEDYLVPKDTYIQSADNRQIKSHKVLIVTLSDATEWVVIRQNDMETRFKGYLYLENALKGNEKVQPAENKLMINGEESLLLSRYHGDQQPQISPLELRDVGFSDLANLREDGGVVYIFDTELSSFEPSVRSKIEAFSQHQDTVLRALEDQGAADRTFDLESVEFADDIDLGCEDAEIAAMVAKMFPTS